MDEFEVWEAREVRWVGIVGGEREGEFVEGSKAKVKGAEVLVVEGALSLS